MTTEELDPSWEQLERSIEQGDEQETRRLVEALASSETALVMSRLDEDDRTRLMTLLPPDEAASVLASIPEEQAADIIETVAAAEAATIVEALPIDDQVEILDEMKPKDAAAILEAMPMGDATALQDALDYPEDSAGHLMSNRVIAFPETATAGEVLDRIGSDEVAVTNYEIMYVYVTDKETRLTGVVRLRDLAVAPRRKPVGEFMIPTPVHAKAEDSWPAQVTGRAKGSFSYLKACRFGGRKSACTALCET